MKKLMKRTVAIAPALVLAFGAQSLNAQEQEEEQVAPQEEVLSECTAEFQPGVVPTGEAALFVVANLTENVGEIVSLEAPEESGLKLADPADAEVSQMSETEEQPEAEEMTTEFTTILWLDTTNATVGSYDVVLHTDNGHCSAAIEVKDEAQQDS